MTLSYAGEAIHVHDAGHLPDRDIARVTGATPSAWQLVQRQASA